MQDESGKMVVRISYRHNRKHKENTTIVSEKKVVETMNACLHPSIQAIHPGQPSIQASHTKPRHHKSFPYIKITKHHKTQWPSNLTQLHTPEPKVKIIESG